MAKSSKDKKTNSIINALGYLKQFSDNELEEIKLSLKDETQRNVILRSLELQIKKGRLLQKMELCNVNIKSEMVFNENSMHGLKEIEKLISLEILKNKLLGIINKKQLLVSKNVIRNLSNANSDKEIEKVLNEIPYSIRVHLGHKFKSKDFERNSIIPIYTPMGNKR